MNENNKNQNTLCDRLENEAEENDCNIVITDLSKDIDFTFTKPIYFELFGKKYSALKSWKQLYVLATRLLYNYNAAAFLTLPDRIITQKNLAEDRYHTPIEIAPDFVIETNRSANNLMANLRIMMNAVDLEYYILKIAYSRDHVHYSKNENVIVCDDSLKEEKSNNLEITGNFHVQDNEDNSNESFGGITGFVLWLVDTGESEKKAHSYLKYLQALNCYAKLCGIIVSDIYTIDDVEELEDIKGRIESNPIWGKLKTSGHKRYSSAMIKYIEYARTFIKPQEGLTSQDKDILL
ncbi:MAG: hypothetical protein LUH07_12790, partial [Lachnospiraceae bacterium]|nr:hypothetical protein [Lachnospiraceae bacterium]